MHKMDKMILFRTCVSQTLSNASFGMVIVRPLPLVQGQCISYTSGIPLRFLNFISITMDNFRSWFWFCIPENVSEFRSIQLHCL
jgi:hypothetical protein